MEKTLRERILDVLNDPLVRARITADPETAPIFDEFVRRLDANEGKFFGTLMAVAAVAVAVGGTETETLFRASVAMIKMAMMREKVEAVATVAAIGGDPAGKMFVDNVEGVVRALRAEGQEKEAA